MRRLWRYILLVGSLAHILCANPVLTCSFSAVGALSNSGCYTAPFNTVETVDLQTAFGTASPSAHDLSAPGSSWNYTTANNLTVGLTLPFDYSGGTHSLLRIDNFITYFDPGSGLWRIYNNNTPGNPYVNYAAYQGMFNSQPNIGAGSPGDHLIGSQAGLGAMEIDFNQGISGIMFRISTPTTGDVNATINAYAVEHPTALDVPIMTYRINSTQSAGLCAGLANGFNAPTPCNTAPWIGIENGNNQIRSVIVNSADSSTYIGNFYIDDGGLGGVTDPEPGTFVLFGSAFAGLAFAAKRRAAQA
jgi:hypothetical protein